MPIKFASRYRIPTTRVQGWDYGTAGYYFVTICTHQKQLSLGQITNGQMQLSPVGVQAKDQLEAIPSHYNHVQLDEYVIMPNYLHAIIILTQDAIPNTINSKTYQDKLRQRQTRNLRLYTCPNPPTLL